MKRMTVLRSGVVLLLIPLSGICAVPAYAVKPESPTSEPSTVDCAKLADPQREYDPQAYTLSSMYMRDKAPEYSIVKGQWILGEVKGIVAAGTCLHILKREVIGVVQIWYLVRYLDAAKKVRNGWVWGGTKGKDEGSYIGGNTNPMIKKGEGPVEQPWVAGILGIFIPAAYAQSDVLPPSGTGFDETVVLKPPVASMEYLVELPLVGWEVSVGSISAVVLFLVMLSGMVAKAIWDETGGDRWQWPSANKLLRPFLVSPIAFSAFWGPMYIQQGSGGLSLTMTLYAFQIGFMWQHVLEKKTGKVE